MQVNISILGDKLLEQKLHNLIDAVQKRVVRSALRKSAKRTQVRITENIRAKGLIKTGKMLEAFQAAKVKSASNNRTILRYGPEWPLRSELGISAADAGYYPAAVEFGHDNVPAYPFVRPALNDHKDDELNKLRSDIGSGIIRVAR